MPGLFADLTLARGRGGSAGGKEFAGLGDNKGTTGVADGGISRTRHAMCKMRDKVAHITVIIPAPISGGDVKAAREDA